MAEALFRNESPIEYFKELVEAALFHQHLQVDDMTAFYVVNLLAGFVRLDRGVGEGVGPDGEALGIRLLRSLEADDSRNRAALRRVGDLTLFISGFFSDSLNRKLVDIDYYVTLGGYAYGSLSRREVDSFASVFAELAAKFVALVDILTEVSEQSAVASNADLLRLYEKWLRTGSRRNGELLAERGIVPNASIGNRFVQ